MFKAKLFTLNLLLLSFGAQAALITQGGGTPYAPLQATVNAPPLNLLVLEKDYKLWMNAYNDASALVDGGPISTGYRGYLLKSSDINNPTPMIPGTQLSPTTPVIPNPLTLDYFGLFDSYKCYQYMSGSSVSTGATISYSSPNNPQTTAKFTPVSYTLDKKCRTAGSGGSQAWSGDWLNYMTTSQMDALTKVLFGGIRNVDTATSTVLQRAYIPANSNSWGKEYTSTAKDGYDIADYTPFSQPAQASGDDYPAGNVPHHLFVSSTPDNRSDGGVNHAPQLLIMLNRQEHIYNWVAKEVPVSGFSMDSSAYTRSGVAGDKQASITPKAFNVYVDACVTNLLEDSDSCTAYGSNYKPTGLLQKYGEPGTMRFGLLTGSYSKNSEGGVLRKKVSTLTDEINPADGTFTTTNGIIATLSKLRIRDWNNSSYSAASWVYNPVAEMLGEALSYFAGGSPNSNFKNDSLGNSLNWTDGAVGNFSGGGLPEVTTWTNPYSTTENSSCAKPYITLISEINPSKDGNSVAPPGTINTSTIGTNMWKNEFATSSNTSGASTVLVGSGNLPVTKSLSSFDSIDGSTNQIAAEPDLGGSYKAPIVASYAATTSLISANANLHVAHYVVALSPIAPTVTIPIQASLTDPNSVRPITITPFAQSTNGAGNKIVGFSILGAFNIPGFPNNKNAGTKPDQLAATMDDPKQTYQGNGGKPIYKFLVSYSDNDSGGGDDDMDAIAAYTAYQSTDTSVTPNREVLTILTESFLAAGGGGQHMGYAIGGTNTVNTVGGANDYQTNPPNFFGDGPYLVVRDCDARNGAAGVSGQIAGGHISGTITNEVPDETGQICATSSRYWSWSNNDDTSLSSDSLSRASKTIGYPFSNTNATSTAPAKYNIKLPLTETRSFVINTGASALADLKNPLWYVAKYGGPYDTNHTNPVTKLPIIPTTNQPTADLVNGVPPSYFAVTNPTKMRTQLNAAFDAINQNAQYSSLVTGGGSSSVGTDQVLYTASFLYDKWPGSLSAYSVPNDSSTAPVVLWTTDDPAKRVAPDSRIMLTLNAATKSGVPFKAANIASTQTSSLNNTGYGATDTYSADRISYLRGVNVTVPSDPTKNLEYNVTINPTGRFRERQKLPGGASNYYGDIIDSSPYFVTGPSLSYRADDSTHVAFVNAYLGRKEMVYVGTNGGMVHGFYNGTGDLKNGGSELLAYVPSLFYTTVGSTVNPKLSKLTSRTYDSSNHEYFVDGQLSVNDVKMQTASAAWDTTNNWSTITAGGFGFGAKGLFALDITDPSGFSEANAAKVARWEFGPTDDTTGDMGYIIDNPLIIKTNDGKYRVVTGNGYNSTNGHAVLYLFEADGPAVSGSTKVWTGKFKTIDTGKGSPSDPNGLSAPAGADLNLLATSNPKGDGTIDVLYAGDLYGNMWKFDISSSDPSQWKVALSGAPLFTTAVDAIPASGLTPAVARQGQPIIGAPAITAHPVAAKAAVDVNATTGIPTKLQGTLVFFGTGKYLADCDKTNNCANDIAVNDFYGVWDDDVVVSKSQLVKRAYKYYTQSALDATGVSTSSNPITLTDVSGYTYVDCGAGSKPGDTCAAIDWTTKKGWYMDLVNQSNIAGLGTRMVGTPRIQSGLLVVFNTLNATTSTDTCSTTGQTTTVAVNYADGNERGGPTFKFTKNGNAIALPNAGFSVGTTLPRGTRTTGNVTNCLGDGMDCGLRYTQKSQGKKECYPDPVTNNVVCQSYLLGRAVTMVNWREIIN